MSDRACRLVATDLDGTLLRSDGAVSPRTRRVLAAVEDAGIPVVFVTARPLRWMDDLWSLVGAHGLAILSNGAVLYDVAARRVVASTGIEREPGLVLVERVRAAVPDCQLAIETLGGIRLEESYDEPFETVAGRPPQGPPHHVPPGSPTGPLEEVWDLPALKLLVRDGDPTRSADDFAAAVVAAVGDAATPTWSGPGLVEVSAPGITKAAALARLCADRGVPAQEVWAFGDMPNDLAMLRWAGTSYAVAGADPSVRSIATEVIGSNDDDGVARVLARLVPDTTDLL